MSIRFARAAELDLATDLVFVAERNPNAAKKLRCRLEILLAKLHEGMYDGPARRLKTGECVRAWVLHPWTIYYNRDADELVVLACITSRVDPSPACPSAAASRSLPGLCA